MLVYSNGNNNYWNASIINAGIDIWLDIKCIFFSNKIAVYIDMILLTSNKQNKHFNDSLDRHGYLKLALKSISYDGNLNLINTFS